jgi:hypothetical protein
MCKEKYSWIFRAVSLGLLKNWWVTRLGNSQIESKLRDDRMARNCIDLGRNIVRFRFLALPDFLKSSGPETGSTQSREYN